MGGKGSGGKKPNQTGRPRLSLSEKAVRKLERAFLAAEKKYGKNWAEIIAEVAHDDSEIDVVQGLGVGKKVIIKKPKYDIAIRMKAIEMWCNYIITKHTEQTITQKKVNIVEMPALDEDPGKKMLEEKKIDPLHKEFIN